MCRSDIVQEFYFQWRVPARSLQTSSVLQHDSLFVHRDSPEDNVNTPFEFTEANKKVKLITVIVVICFLKTFFATHYSEFENWKVFFSFGFA